MNKDFIHCDDCGEMFEKRHFYTDINGTHICKYCYDGNYYINDKGEFVEKEFDIEDWIKINGGYLIAVFYF